MLTPFSLLLLIVVILAVYDLIYNPATKLADVCIILLVVFLLLMR